MDRGSGVFIKYGVAARGFYMFFNFVKLLWVKSDRNGRVRGYPRHFLTEAEAEDF